MNLAPYSYTGPSGVATILDGTAGSHFTATITPTTIQPDASVNWTTTNSGKDPFPSGKQIKGSMIELLITCRGVTLGTDLSTLASVFDVHDTALRTFICKDADDSSRQWFVVCNCYAMPRNNGRNVTVRLAVKSSYWLTVNTITESTWSVTASGQTQAFTINLGNVDTLPVISLTPTSAKTGGGGGGAYRRPILIYNRTQSTAHSYPIDITNGGLDTSALIQNTAISNQINNGAGYNSAAVTFAIDTAVGGGLPVGGGMWYCQRTGEQGGYVAISAGSMTGITRGIGGSTAAALLDNDVLVNSKMMKNGDDVFIYVGDGNGALTVVPRWFGDSGTAVINSTATKIWISQNFAVRARGTLAANIVSGATTFVLNNAEGNIPALNGLCLIESELIAVGRYIPANASSSGNTRGVMGTSAASHSPGVSVIFLPQMWMVYGDQTAPAPVYSDANKPVFNLATSTNSSWVYANFQYAAQVDASRWNAAKSGADAVNYSLDQSNQGVDPVSDIGVTVVRNGSYAYWEMICAFGYTQAAFTGVDRYNLPANQGYFRDTGGTNVLAITASTLANTWQSTSQTFTPADTRTGLRIYLQNTKVTAYATRAYVSAGGCTVTLSSATTSTQFGVPSVTMSAEQAITYAINATITNNATGESIQIVYTMAVNQTLEIDTLNKKITYLLDNSDAFSSLRPFPARNEWLRMIQGSNTFLFTETSVAGMSVVVKHQDRSNTPA